MGGIVDLVKAGRADAAMCRADWRRLLNDEYGKFEPFFEIAVGVVTGSYPGADGIVRYDVRQHGKIWFGMHQDGSPDTEDSPWLRLSREDVLLWRLNAEGRKTAENMADENKTVNCVTFYYLFASSDGTTDRNPGEVFYRVDHGESVANSLCKMFTAENAKKKGVVAFYYAPASGMTEEAQVLLDEAIEKLEVYDDPDPGVYDPSPSRGLMMRAQYALRARAWEERVRQKSASEARPDGQPSGDKGGVPPSPDEKATVMSAEERVNSGLHLLMLFTQGYYKMLESAVGLRCYAADTELNHFYLWTIKNLRQLLNKHPDLSDFNEKFEPYLPDLLPSTTCDVEWADMAAPEAEHFLSAVQSYVMDKGIYDPAEGSAAQVLIEMFRPGVTKAIEVAEAYRTRMKEHFGELLEPTARRAAQQAQAPEAGDNKLSPESVPKPAPVAPASANKTDMPNLSGIFDDSHDIEREEAKMAAWSTVHRSDPSFVPRTLTVNDKAFCVELGPRMTRVYNMYLDPDEFLDICADYGLLMDVEYVGEEKTLVVRLHCEAEPLPFPQRITLGSIPERWENECGEYGRVEFDSGHYLPVRGFRIKDTTAADRSLICANRFERGRRPQSAGAGDALPSQPSVCPAPPRTERQLPQGASVGETVAFPLQVGRFKVYDNDWSVVTFQNSSVALSPELKKVYKAMHMLGAVSDRTARTKKDILQAAGLPRIDRSLSNVLCPSGPKKDFFESLYTACISKIEQRPPMYYLTQ